MRIAGHRRQCARNINIMDPGKYYDIIIIAERAYDAIEINGHARASYYRLGWSYYEGDNVFIKKISFLSMTCFWTTHFENQV